MNCRICKSPLTPTEIAVSFLTGCACSDCSRREAQLRRDNFGKTFSGVRDAIDLDDKIETALKKAAGK